MKTRSVAAARFIEQATSAAGHAQAKEEIDRITGYDLPRVAALMDLLAEHPAVAADATLSGAADAIKTLLVATWDRLEAAAGKMAGAA